MASSPREFTPQFWCVVGATFLGFLGIGTVLPGLAPHVRHDLGGSDETVGFVIGVFSFVALGARFFSGTLADLNADTSADRLARALNGTSFD
jgi:MFS family permease